MSAGELYKERLRADKREIRTIALYPGQPGEDIQCSMQTVSLDERPRYTALSYVWGDPANTRPICVDGKTFNATVNLESALRQIRRQDEKEVLVMWVDAICINQADVEEQNQQVGLMGPIYSDAETVIAWLGDADHVSDSLATIVERGIPSPPAEDAADHASLRYEYAVEIHRIQMLFLIIATRPWWTRVWIVQECVLPKNEPVLRCGTKILPWTKFFETLQECLSKSGREAPLVDIRHHPSFRDLNPFLDKILSENATLNESLSRFFRLRTMREAYLSDPNHQSLCSIVFMCAGQQSTVPHDHIYGTLGMVAEDDRKQVLVDYRRSYWDTFRKVMENCLATEHLGSLELLSMISFHSTSHGHPSWIPDFSCQAGMLRYTGIFLAYPECWRSLSGLRFSDSGDVLMLDGLYLDVVSQAYPITQDYHDWASSLAKLESLAKSAVADLSLHSEGTSRRFPQDLLSGMSRCRYLRSLFTANNERTTRWCDDEQLDMWWEVMMDRNHERRKEIQGPESNQPRPGLGGISLQTLVTRTLGQTFQACNGRCLVTTKDGLLGIGMPHVQPGDVLVCIFGMNMPLILRPVDDCYTIVGGVYVGGLTELSLLDRHYEQVAATTFHIQ